MSGRAAIHLCSLVLAHAPTLVRHGSKPPGSSWPTATACSPLAAAARVRGRRLRPPPGPDRQPAADALWDVERPWWANPVEPSARGPFGLINDQAELYRRMLESDSFGLLRLDRSPAANGGLTIHEAGVAAGSMAGAHDLDESLSASILLENLACKATGALALEHLLQTTASDPAEVPYVIGSGEEAVGDRYQRGGNLAKAIAEQADAVMPPGAT